MNAAGVQSSGSEIAADMRLMRNEGVMHADSGWISVTPGDYAEVFVLQGSGAALNLMGDAGTLWRSWFQAEFAG